ncbi:MAG: alcohol dehydrogenase catalytic domain-containing protein [Eubacteriales bacterium]
MKAMVLEGYNKMAVYEVKKPTITDDEALVRVRACAVCGSDIRIFHSGNSRVSYPAIVGHEVSGEVVEVGKNVTKVKVGDRIAIGGDVPCGECVFCEAGIGNNCQINYAVGYQFQGGFAEYMPLNRLTLTYGPVHKIPDNMSFEEGALAEPLACILNGLELLNVRMGDVVTIVGAGPIGCIMANVVKKMGAIVILVEYNKERLDYAKKVVNADVFVCSSEEDMTARVLKETKGLGADVVVTACPSPEVQQESLKMAKNRARICFFGGLSKDRENVVLNTNIIHYKELIITGAHGAMPVHHQKAIDLIASGTIDVKPFITETFSLDDVALAFAKAESKEGMRVVVKP